MGQRFSWLRGHIARHRTLIGEFAFELIIVFAGVTAAFALENFREGREEAAYRHRMVAALRASLADLSAHGLVIDRQMDLMLRGFDAARAKGEKPSLPVYREAGSERPDTKAWDGIVATGAARSLDPTLFFRLARFYSRTESIGERYERYNAFSEARVLPYVADRDEFYEPNGTLKPEFAAYVDRLRDIQREQRATIAETASLRDALSE